MEADQPTANVIEQHAANEETNAFDPKEVAVSLAGKTYVWPMPVRRRGREMLRRINPILVKTFVRDRKNKTPEEVVNLLEAADMMLDFFYAFHPDMREDKQRLDATEENEISSAFAEVVNFVSSPFSKGGVSVNADEVPQNFRS